MEGFFQRMIENKIRYKLAVRIREMSNADLKDMDITYHLNAMQELQFTARCSAYGRDGTRYIMEGSIDDNGEIRLYPEKYEKEAV